MVYFKWYRQVYFVYFPNYYGTSDVKFNFLTQIFLCDHFLDTISSQSSDCGQDMNGLMWFENSFGICFISFQHISSIYCNKFRLSLCAIVEYEVYIIMVSVNNARNIKYIGLVLNRMSKVLKIILNGNSPLILSIKWIINDFVITRFKHQSAQKKNSTSHGVWLEIQWISIYLILTATQNHSTINLFHISISISKRINQKLKISKITSKRISEPMCLYQKYNI